jgi:FKBP-type peptidyl-prolyl cis-trans isomerase FklB
VSYGIGTQVGQNLKDQFRNAGMDSLNYGALSAGLKDALDSTMSIPTAKVTSLVQAYMIEVQKKGMSRQQAEAEKTMRDGEAWLTENGKKPGVITTASGLQYMVVTPGAGPKPEGDQELTVHYRGTLIDGTQFDSSYDRGEPYVLHPSRMIQGWQEALHMMQAGSKWKVFVPANLAYGAQGNGRIPPYSVLLFDMELISLGAK